MTCSVHWVVNINDKYHSDWVFQVKDPTELSFSSAVDYQEYSRKWPGSHNWLTWICHVNSSMEESLPLSRDRGDQEINLCGFKLLRLGVECYHSITPTIGTDTLDIFDLTGVEHISPFLVTLCASFCVNVLFMSLHVSVWSSWYLTTHFSRLNLVPNELSGRMVKSV